MQSQPSFPPMLKRDPEQEGVSALMRAYQFILTWREPTTIETPEEGEEQAQVKPSEVQEGE